MAQSETKSSQPRLSAAEKMIERMKVYSSFRPDQVQEYRKAFDRMISEFGEQRVSKGLDLAIDAIPSFPATPAEIRKYIPPAVVSTCGNCSDGWIRGFKDAAGNEAVRRCLCVSQ